MADAAKSGDVLLVSTPWGVTRQVIESLGNLTGKIAIDATNPVLPDLSGLSLGTTTSAAEQVAQWASGARRQSIQHNRIQHNGRAVVRPQPRAAVLLRRRCRRQTECEIARRRTRLRSASRRPASSSAAAGAVRHTVDLPS
jgi:hypothetical protein